MIIIKWVILMTYLVTSHEVPSTESLDESNCAPLPESLDEVIGCIHGATPGPVTYDTVTKFVGGLYDSLADCQDVVDRTMVTYTAAEPKDRLYRGLILQCKEAKVETQ